MGSLESAEVVRMFVGLAVLLATARGLGSIATRFHQPAVLGELTAGILLGPSLLGMVWPFATDFMFPRLGPVAVVEDGVRQLAVVLFLLAAGLEVDLSTVWRRSRTVIWVSLGGMVVPFGLGYLAAGYLSPGQTDETTFRLMVATALSISALPVTARILMDLGLFRTELGMSVIGAAVVDDLIGWNLFALLLSRLAGNDHPPSLIRSLLTTVILAAVIVLAGRHAAERFIKRMTRSAGDLVSVLLGLALLMAAFTEYLGLHALFGAFLIGVAFGNAQGMTPGNTARISIKTLVFTFLAPLYFGGVALKVNFFTNFDLGLTLAILTLAMAGKLLGCGLASRCTGMSWSMSWAVGFGMNGRGAMEIVLATIALSKGLIGEPMFVSLVCMAWITSAISGPMMRRLMRHAPEINSPNQPASPLLQIAMQPEEAETVLA